MFPHDKPDGPALYAIGHAMRPVDKQRQSVTRVGVCLAASTQVNANART